MCEKDTNLESTKISCSCENCFLCAYVFLVLMFSPMLENVSDFIEKKSVIGSNGKYLILQY